MHLQLRVGKSSLYVLIVLGLQHIFLEETPAFGANWQEMPLLLPRIQRIHARKMSAKETLNLAGEPFQGRLLTPVVLLSQKWTHTL